MSRHVYPLRATRFAHGIRAQELRVLPRASWWARRWVAALEAMRLGARIGRGRQYAISGQIEKLSIRGPHVEAMVVGSREEPYRVRFDFTSADDAAAKRIMARLHADPMLVARLLTDDLPGEVEEIFREERLPLFPCGELPDDSPFGVESKGGRRWDVRMDCTCPDWSRPCKHQIAVLFLLGEEILHRPSTLLALRGIDVESSVVESVDDEECDAPDELDLPGTEVVSTLTDPAPLVARLGPVPFWRGENRCVDALRRIAGRVRTIAQSAAKGESIDCR